MGSTTLPSRAKRAPVLRGACEKSARSVISAIQRTAPRKASSEALTELLDSLTGVIEDNEAMTTQEAADLLNVSRPHLVKLLETGQIPQLPKVGRHRRVARVAVLKYKRTHDAKRESALKELAALSQRHNLGY